LKELKDKYWIKLSLAKEELIILEIRIKDLITHIKKTNKIIK
jgi:hypothetical protein